MVAWRDYTRLMKTQSPGWKLQRQQHSPNESEVMLMTMDSYSAQSCTYFTASKKDSCARVRLYNLSKYIVLCLPIAQLPSILLVKTNGSKPCLLITCPWSPSCLVSITVIKTLLVQAVSSVHNFLIRDVEGPWYLEHSSRKHFSSFSSIVNITCFCWHCIFLRYSCYCCCCCCWRWWWWWQWWCGFMLQSAQLPTLSTHTDSVLGEFLSNVSNAAGHFCNANKAVGRIPTSPPLLGWWKKMVPTPVELNTHCMWIC